MYKMTKKKECKLCKQLQEDFGTKCEKHIVEDAKREATNRAVSILESLECYEVKIINGRVNQLISLQHALKAIKEIKDEQ